MTDELRLFNIYFAFSKFLKGKETVFILVNIEKRQPTWTSMQPKSVNDIINF